MHDETGAATSRRDLIKKGAVVGGVVWAAPVVQSMAAGAQSSVVTCDLTVIPAPGVGCDSNAPFRARTENGAGGGQFRAVSTGEGLFEVTWPLTPVCPTGCQLEETWAWAVSGVNTTNCNGTDQAVGFNNANLVSPTNLRIAQIQKLTLSLNLGITLTVTATFSCGGGTPQVFTRTERIRQIGGVNQPFHDTFLP